MVKQRLFIRTDDIVRMEGCSSSNASRKLNHVRLCLKKSKKKPVTIADYCRYWEIDQTTAEQFIFQVSPTK
jgi:hypothetical protein